MNLLYYCNEYPPYRNGGIGSAVKIVAEAMANRGHRVIVAGKYFEIASQDRLLIEENTGVKVMRFLKRNYRTPRVFLTNTLLFICSQIGLKRLCPKLTAIKNRQIYYRTQELLSQIIRQYKIDIMEVPDYEDSFFEADIAFPVKHMFFPIPVVMRVHGCASFISYYLNNKKDSFREQLDRDYYHSVDEISAVSEFSKQYVEEHLCPGKRISVIYNPIESAWFEKNRNKGESKTILFFGKIVKTKGAFNLVKAFDSIADLFPDIVLKMIGNGDKRQILELISSHNRGRVLFPGFMSKENLLKEIDHSLFCVLPSYFENFSMAALEVLARDKALIYTNRSSGHELIEDGVNGLLVDPDNVEQIAKKMLMLLTDEVLRNRLADRGYEMCKKRFSTETIIPQMESYYKEVIKGCRK